MSDAVISGIVTITANGGGWYTLTTEANPDGERVQGKEAADVRAAAINAEATPAEGTIPPQGSIDDAAKTIPPAVADLPPVPEPVQPFAGGDMAEFMQQFMEMQKRLAELEAAQPVVTVTTTEPAAQPGVVPGFVPREYAGRMDPRTKQALADLGFGVTTIVLEENDSIPPTGLFIGHNGKAYMIKPGEEVDVPNFIISVLDDAVMSTPIVNDADKKVLGYRDRSKYPYRVINAKG